MVFLNVSNYATSCDFDLKTSNIIIPKLCSFFASSSSDCLSPTSDMETEALADDFDDENVIP